MNSTCAVLYVVVIFISFAGRSIEDASCCTCTSPSLPQLLNKPSEQMQQLLQFSLSRSRGVAGNDEDEGSNNYHDESSSSSSAGVNRLKEECEQMSTEVCRIYGTQHTCTVLHIFNETSLIGESRGCAYNMALLFLLLSYPNSEVDVHVRQLKTQYNEIIHTLKAKGSLTPDLLNRFEKSMADVIFSVLCYDTSSSGVQTPQNLDSMSSLSFPSSQMTSAAPNGITFDCSHAVRGAHYCTIQCSNHFSSTQMSTKKHPTCLSYSYFKSKTQSKNSNLVLIFIATLSLLLLFI